MRFGLEIRHQDGTRAAAGRRRGGTRWSVAAAVGALRILSSLTLPALTLPPQAPPALLPALPSLPLPPLPTARPQSRRLRPSPQHGSRQAAESQHHRSLGYIPPPSRDLAQLPNLNTVSRYLTVGLTLEATTQKLTWDFKRSVDHSSLFETDGNFDQGNCGSCWAYAAARAIQAAYALVADPDSFPSGMRLSVQQLVDCTGAAAAAPAAPSSNNSQYPRLPSARLPALPGSCWAYATARAFQARAAYALVAEPDSFPGGTRLSVQQLVDCTGAAASPNAITTPPPFPSALPPLQELWKISMYEQVLLPGPLGLAAGPKYNISMYEQVPLPGPLGLILALQNQPVIVTIRASSQDFIDYSGGIYEGVCCYSPLGTVMDSGGRGEGGDGYGATATATNNTALLDHVMLAVGYNYDAPGSWENYFILKNSWGPQWGEGGYMKIRMENGPFGTCGMLVNRGLYPIVNGEARSESASAARTSSHSLPPLCSHSPSPLPTVNVCSILPNNPCAVGQCINSGVGGYSCLCPPNYKPSLLASGQTTCVPGEARSVYSCLWCGGGVGMVSIRASARPNTSPARSPLARPPACLVSDRCLLLVPLPAQLTKRPAFSPLLAFGQITCVPDMSTSSAAAVQRAYTVQGGETCGAIYGFIGLTQEQFLLQNEDVDCDDLKAGQVLNTSIPASAQVCRVRYSVTQADAAAKTCDLINDRFGIDVTTINPSLDCSSLVPNQQICIQVGDAVSGVADYNLCTSYLPVNEWITCADPVDSYGLSWLDLYRLNPGLNCDTLSSLTGSEGGARGGGHGEANRGLVALGRAQGGVLASTAAPSQHKGGSGGVGVGGTGTCTGTPLGAVACGKARSKTVANRRYTVGAGDSCASLVVVQFQRQPPLVGQLNRNWMCRSLSLFAGMPLCIPS
ncbi:unnamed protein product [Closterium sp. Naga37s-1]|nr:unnamed protein product [Closterium sp. Naga37s-1]